MSGVGAQNAGTGGNGDLAASLDRDAGQGGGGAQGSGAQAAFADNWHESLSDADLRTTIENKGWNNPQGPENLVKSYRELETLMGGKLDGYTKIPGEDADDDARTKFFTDLGRPAEIEGYQPPTFENLKEGDTVPDWFRNVAFESGLSQEQYGKVMGAYDAYAAEIQDQEAQQLEEAAKQGNEELKREWGADYPEKVAIGNRAVKALGISKEEIVGLQDVLGTARATKILAGIGANIGEDTSVWPGEDGGGSPFAGDAAWAHSEKTKLMGNEKFMAALGDPTKLQDPSIRPLVEKWDRVNQIIAQSQGA